MRPPQALYRCLAPALLSALIGCTSATPFFVTQNKRNCNSILLAHNAPCRGFLLLQSCSQEYNHISSFDLVGTGLKENEMLLTWTHVGNGNFRLVITYSDSESSYIIRSSLRT
jgi:hypothetical protein